MLLTYKTYFSKLNRNKLRGEIAPHKPILLLALIDYIQEKMSTEEGKIAIQQPIPLRPELQMKFNRRWMMHVNNSTFKPSYVNPIVHMQYEPFYQLVPKAERSYNGSYSLQAVENAFIGIQLDTELIQLILHKETRVELMEFLIEIL